MAPEKLVTPMTPDDFFFDYDLPEKLIAQEPTARREDSRLLVVRVSSQTLEHRHFRDLPDLLEAGDLIVRNDTKVLPARVIGARVKTGGRWEGLYLGEPTPGTWEMLANTRGFPDLGETFATESRLTLTLVGRTEDRHWLMTPNPPGDPAELLAKHGLMPLPPYIRKGKPSKADLERYQTTYAQTPGSVAAPTAGLHFTPALFETLAARGITAASVTLHVGLGTFAPVKASDPRDHALHAEWCEVTSETIARIHEAKRVIAVGTTTTRTLESAARNGELQPYRGPSDMYIYPPYDFRVIDGLITNFHLPKTTLLLLVQSLTGSDLLRRAYTEAIAAEYRFFSYGDAMLVLP
ncbi:MAG: tRNA preQ1(34) S-adenosylmethionine ribosyltransferase-isomerase QueA [Fimbriiglobus sp.]